MDRTSPLSVAIVAAFLAVSFSFPQVPADVFDRAAAAFGRQNYAEAEQVLRPALAAHPRDARAWGLMGAILDAEKRFAEAEPFYQRALAITPNSASLYGNLGNHYLEQGQTEKARQAYLRVVALDPANRNANSQLAQMLVDQKKGAEALRYLDRLPKEDQATPAVQLLRARALRETGQAASAEAVLQEVLKHAGQDVRVAYSVGMLFAEWKDYVPAEEAFATALASAPGNFEVLYNQGLAALAAHDTSRAAEAFQAALEQHPGDVDCLIGLARVKDELHRDDQAAGLLFQAQHTAPERADLLEFLGNVLAKLGLYRDAAAAYDQCLKAHPESDTARRECGYALARAAKLTEALEDLNWYVGKHSRDPIGWFELAATESLQQKEKALEHFNRALELDPKMAPAHLARGILLRQEGKVSQAITDLKFVLAREPDNFRAWEELGEASLATSQTTEALTAFERAARLAPENAEVLWRYGRALQRAGQKAAAEEVLAKVKALGKTSGALASPEVLSLESSGQPANLATLQELARANPTDTRLKLQVGETLLREGKVADALSVFQEIRSSGGQAAAGDCGEALLNAGQYKAAREFLQEAAEAEPSNAQRRLDLALATFHDSGPEPALVELDRTPAAARAGDYYLLRAQLLDSLHRPQEAAEALNQGIQSSPTRPDLYFQAALFLINHDQVQQMINFLEKADIVVPNNPQLWLTRAIGLAILHQDDPAAALLTKMETLWPEWYLPYLVHGLVLSYRVRPAEAKPRLETAVALGARQPTAYYHLAAAIITTDPAQVAEAQAAIREALALNPKDPYIQSLAGKIAYLKKDYPAAVEHLRAALEIWPDMVEAHERLSTTYRAMGKMDKFQEERNAVARIKQQHPGVEIPPFPADDLLFKVSEPAALR